MDEKSKLRVLIPHWIEHNEEHANEFLKWSQFAAEAGDDILAAVDEMRKANAFLELALKKLGGPLEVETMDGL